MHIPIKRSSTDKVFGGVLGGIAEKYDWSSTTLRLIYVLISLTPFPGILVYLVLLLLMEKPYSNDKDRRMIH